MQQGRASKSHVRSKSCQRQHFRRACHPSQHAARPRAYREAKARRSLPALKAARDPNAKGAREAETTADAGEPGRNANVSNAELERVGRTFRPPKHDE